MQTSRLSERLEAAILEQVFSDDELENRVRGLLRWKIRFNAVDVAVVSGHVILSGRCDFRFGPRNRGADCSQIEGRARCH